MEEFVTGCAFSRKAGTIDNPSHAKIRSARRLERSEIEKMIRIADINQAGQFLITKSRL